MSSASSSQIDHHEPVFIIDETCYCNEMVKMRESWRDGNLARRFINCAKSLVSPNHCNFFSWVDPKLNKHYRDTIMRFKALASGSAAWKLEQELEKVENKLAKTESKLLHEKEKRASEKSVASTRIGELQKEVFKLRRIMMVVLVLVGVLIGIIWYIK